VFPLVNGHIFQTASIFPTNLLLDASKISLLDTSW